MSDLELEQLTDKLAIELRKMDQWKQEKWLSVLKGKVTGKAEAANGIVDTTEWINYKYEEYIA